MGSGDMLGGGVALALAAGLWLLYLMPAWFRRREFLSTERNAVRLQQTLRIMAETAETPDAVRAEVSRRGVSEQRRAQRQQTAATAAAALSPQGSRHRAQRRLRLARLATTLLVVAAAVTAGVSTVQLFGGSTVSGVIALVAGGVLWGGVSLLGRMSTVSRQRAAAEPMARPSLPLVDHAGGEQRQARSQLERNWTPNPLPKPLYLSAETAVPSSGTLSRERLLALARLQAESQSSEEALRQAQRSVPSIGVPSTGVDVPLEEEQPPERLRPAAVPLTGVQAAVARSAGSPAAAGAASGSGRLGDLDAVMRRRRAAG